MAFQVRCYYLYKIALLTFDKPVSISVNGGAKYRSIGVLIKYKVA
jgi:hypothetical protein